MNPSNPYLSQKIVEGDFNYIYPTETTNLDSVKATGEINIRVKGGKVGNMTSSNGSVKIVMSDSVETGNVIANNGISISAIDPTTPQNVLDFLKNCGKNSIISQTKPSLTERVQQEIIQNTSINNIVGAITRCTLCGVNSTKMEGENRTGITKMTSDGIVFSDPANQVHRVSENGIYQIINEGDGRYQVKRISDHNHI